ncbi:MAG: BTAD domain-containing putative transcriptional regulator [Patulibacter minatonensis]
MQVGVLGALQVRRGDEALEVAGGRLGTLLACLALSAGRPVPRDTLIDAIWDVATPSDAGHSLQALVSRLRRALGPGDWIGSSAAGYTLALSAEAVDALLFEELAARGGEALRAGDAPAALAMLTEADALWRGPALGDLVAAAPFARDAAARLEDRRRAAAVDRIDAALATGAAPASLLRQLDDLAAADPLNERVAARRLRALAAAGRSADALRAYEALRRQLDDELGAVPSAELAGSTARRGRRIGRGCRQRPPPSRRHVASSPTACPRTSPSRAARTCASA